MIRRHGGIAVACLSLSLALATTALGGEGSARERCREVGITALWVGWNPQDACASDLPAESRVQAVLEGIGEVHTRAAAFLGLSSIQALLPEGLVVRLREQELGSLASSSWRGEIALGVLPDWEAGSVNLPVYAHELGHVLSDLPHLPLHRFLASLDAHPLMRESLADLVALALMGRLMEADRDVPTCLDRVRYVTDFQTYRYPEGYFDDQFFDRRVERCCGAILKNPGNGGVLPHWKKVCGGWVREIEERVWEPLSRRPLAATPPNDRGVLAHGKFMDIHQIGVPITSLFLRLSGRVGIPVAELFRQALFLGAEAGREERFVCRIQLKELPFEREEWQHPVMALFDGLVRALGEAGRPAFDEEWDRHGMEYARAFDRVWLPRSVKGRFSFALQQELEALHHPCASQPGHPLCQLSCEPVRASSGVSWDSFLTL